MSSASFEALPKELIAHIASFTEPSSALHLSATCQTIRAATWAPLIFKSILIASHHSYWNESSFDLDAIASRAGNDVSIWARFCIADERANTLAKTIPDDPSRIIIEVSHPLQAPKKYVSFLPELLVVKHPFMGHQCWEAAILCRRDANPSQIFCLAMTILATNENMLNVISNLYSAKSDWFPHRTDTRAFLWALCNIALWARTQIKQRLAAWPYNYAARVPLIGIPKAVQIPLRPFNEAYNLPVPFSRRAGELLGKPTSSFSAWDSWYQISNYEKFRSAEIYFTDGNWCGYYIFFGTPQINIGIDSPMNIKFESSDFELVSNEPLVFNFVARDCVDGMGAFNLTGSITSCENDIKIAAEKRYQNRPLGCDWDCRLTPFGLVGFWGSLDRERNRMQRDGILWLWKSEWTATASS